MLRQPGHGVIITNGTGKYLMQFRDSTPRIPHPLMWEFFGGSSENAESVIEAAIRELKEELDIEASGEELTVVAHHLLEGIDEYLLRFARPVEWGEFIVKEGAGCGYFSKDELLQLPIPDRVRFFVETYM